MPNARFVNFDNKKRLSFHAIHQKKNKSLNPSSKLGSKSIILNKSSDINKYSAKNQNSSFSKTKKKFSAIVQFGDLNSHIAKYRAERKRLFNEDGVAQLQEKTIHQAANKVLMFQKAKSSGLKEYITKKRNMLLMQLSIDNKTELINKLNGEVKTKKEGLKEVETRIKADNTVFTDYVDAVRHESREVIKNTENLIKSKLDVMAKLKKMSEEKMFKLTANRKLLEKIEDLLRYRKFFKRIFMIDKDSSSIEHSVKKESLSVIGLHKLYKFKLSSDCIDYLNNDYCELLNKDKKINLFDRIVNKIEESNLLSIENYQRIQIDCEQLEKKQKNSREYYNNLIEQLNKRKAGLEKSIVDFHNSESVENGLHLKSKSYVDCAYDILANKISEIVTNENKDDSPVILLARLEKELSTHSNIIADADPELIKKIEKNVQDAQKARHIKQLQEEQQRIIKEKQKRLQKKNFSIDKKRRHNFRSYFHNTRNTNPKVGSETFANDDQVYFE